MPEIQHPFPAYVGDDPYVFASYCHKDKALVYPDLLHLRDAGFPIWYDEGIPMGKEWPTEVEHAVEKSTVATTR
jgi:hypothetical protein